ncbi:MAG: aldolase/citrate lyase family protein [Chloroflexota bacterium]|nr:aldolase/citrate lyase family protein [Chloroflexota bacterium]MDP6757240.1 aldolase/citrate lyase family protein [Chloroflexota bacterium]
MRCNRLRELMDAGEPSIGTRIISQWPASVEIAGLSGEMDYVEFVSEYGPYDLFSLENFARAVDLFDHMSSIIKLDQEPRTYLAIRALGAGIENVLYSDVRNVEEARACVAAVRADSPGNGGLRGVGGTRDNEWGYGTGTVDFIQQSNNVVVAIMVEKKSLVDDIENVLAVDGIDMVQFGPSDYSMNTGNARDLAAPEVKEAELHTIKTALKLGVHPRVELSNPKEALPYLELGVKHFNLGSELSILRNFWAIDGKELRDIVVKG